MDSATREGLLWLWIIILVLVSVIASGSAAFALPHVYWNPVTGDDANNGLNKSNAVQTLARCRELLNFSDVDNDTGFKWDEADTATLLLPENFDILELTMKRAKDKTHSDSDGIVIDGHGNLPLEKTDDSENAGYRINKKYIWATFVNNSGPQERLIRLEDTIEIY